MLAFDSPAQALVEGLAQYKVFVPDRPEAMQGHVLTDCRERSQAGCGRELLPFWMRI